MPAYCPGKAYLSPLSVYTYSMHNLLPLDRLRCRINEYASFSHSKDFIVPKRTSHIFPEFGQDSAPIEIVSDNSVTKSSVRSSPSIYPCNSVTLMHSGGEFFHLAMSGQPPTPKGHLTRASQSPISTKWKIMWSCGRIDPAPLSWKVLDCFTVNVPSLQMSTPRRALSIHVEYLPLL